MSFKTIYSIFKNLLKLIFFYLTLPGLTLAAFDENICSKNHVYIPFESQKATAGFFANFWNRSGSVSFESEKIFQKAKEKMNSIQVPKLKCPIGCTLNRTPNIYFKSSPERFQSEYEDKPYCLNQKKLTEITPIQYTMTSINSIESLMSWIGDLTQGKGTEGKDLYHRCDLSCSPHYEYLISIHNKSDENYSVKASIVCGEARDKSHNIYNLSSFFRFDCEIST
ncbi:MAG: hypothetical protein SGJ02_04585 [bacterium]|nr:hypothetical protein [bacterium]